MILAHMLLWRAAVRPAPQGRKKNEERTIPEITNHSRELSSYLCLVLVGTRLQSNTRIPWQGLQSFDHPKLGSGVNCAATDLAARAGDGCSLCQGILSEASTRASTMSSTDDQISIHTAVDSASKEPERHFDNLEVKLFQGPCARGKDTPCQGSSSAALPARPASFRWR